jgi:hypothetical protein
MANLRLFLLSLRLHAPILPYTLNPELRIWETFEPQTRSRCPKQPSQTPFKDEDAVKHLKAPLPRLALRDLHTPLTHLTSLVPH